MCNRRRNNAFIFALLLTIPFIFAGAKKKEGPGLIGSWQCKSAISSDSLVFKSENNLIFNDEAFNYTLAPGVIRVQEEYGLVDYPYTLDKGILNVIMPDGTMLRCTKAGDAGQKAAERGMAGEKKAGGQEYQLRGTLCQWAGGSPYASSSYSRTTRITFDGNGRFSYGSETSFGSKEGMAYGGSPVNGGTYRIEGDKVYLTFSDGSTGAATVHMRQNDGRITELMYNGELYATGLCE